MLIILSSAINIIIIIIFVIFSHPASSLDYCSNQTCGNLSISYPFSLNTAPGKPACPSFSSFFELECKSGQLYLNNVVTFFNANFTSDSAQFTSLQLIEINNDSLIVDMTNLSTVLTTSTQNQSNYSYIQLPTFPGPYFISNDNKFGSFGCMLGMLVTATVYNYSKVDNSYIYSDVEVGGCYVYCPADEKNPNCGNHSCCVSSFPPGSSPRYASYEVYDSIMCNSTCLASNYANLFHPDYTDFNKSLYRLKLDWALPSNQTNNTNALKKSPDYACSHNANLTVVEGVPGYLCSCYPGYEGDGYSKGSGCKDLDECKYPSKNDCIPGSTTCKNLEGSYTCQCNSRFYVGEGRISGSGCKFSPHVRNAFAISSTILVLALLMGGFIFLSILWRKRTKMKYFMQNGGLQLQAFIIARGRDTTRIFSAEELKVATNNYSNEMKLGVGGFGTVFKGILEDGRVVAIKKANRDGDRGNEQFLNEIDILMQINHRHIVRLLGCCLETVTPLLVYEYVSNGNVAENLKSKGDSVMGWKQRLKVARQTAEALAYLHAAASPPILHRDVKSTNVLLDHNLDAKVADFGVSRLIPEGVEHVSTAVQGTLGYLDPEYFQTLQLTDKSDVYSLGVMLVELVTGLKAVDNHNREPRFANLALFFIDHMREGRGEEIIDPRLDNPSSVPSDVTSHTYSSIMAVATLAHHCLALLSAERPSMSHVAIELHHITQSLQNTNEDDDVTLPLLPSKQKYVDCEAGAVVAQNAQYYIQSSSNVMSSDNLLSNSSLTMPR